MPGRRFQIDPDRDLWDRQINETDPAWEAFQHYRDSGTDEGARRSTRATAHALDKSRQLVGQWSADHHWQDRVQAFDRHLDASRLAESADQVRRAVKRHGRHLEGAALALIAPIEAYLRKLGEAREGGANPFEGYDLRELGREAKDAARLIPALVQAERLVLGLSTERGEHTVGDADRAAAEQRVAGMTRSGLDDFLLGVDAGRQAGAVEPAEEA